MTPQVTVLNRRNVYNPANAAADGVEYYPGEVHSVALAEALERNWPTDAHFAAYEPITLPELGVLRLVCEDVDAAEIDRVRMVAMIGDLDDVIAKSKKAPAREEWRAEQRPRLEASGLAYHETRSGFRTVATLADPIEITSLGDAAVWTDLYLGWCEYIEQEFGLKLDRACADWPHLFRLPNVDREGVGVVTAKVIGKITACDPCVQWAEPTNAPKHTATGPVDKSPLPPIGEVDPRDAEALEALCALHSPPGEDPERRLHMRATGGYLAKRGLTDERIAALVSRIPTANTPISNVEQAIECAREWRRGSKRAAGWKKLKAFNPEGAALLQRATESGYARRARERQEARAAAKTAPNPPEPKGVPAVAEAEAQAEEPAYDDWDAPEEPIAWYCEGLGIAASERKITLIGGDPGAGKGPLAGYLAVCFALGLKAFDVHPCKQCNVGILDFEGARLSRGRIRSHMRGLKRSPGELKGRLFIRDVGSEEMAELGWLSAWIAKHKIEVLIVDAYTRAVSGLGIEPNAQEFAHLAGELAPLLPVTIAVAHARKPAAGKAGERPTLGDIAGSFALAGAAATAIAVWKPDEDDRNLIRIGCMRSPDEEFQTFDLRWEKDLVAPKDAPVWRAKLVGVTSKAGRTGAAERKAALSKDERLTDVTARVIDHMWGNAAWPRTVHAIHKDTGMHARDVGTVLSALHRAGLAHHQPSSKGTSGGTYQLAETGTKKPRVVMQGDTARVDDSDMVGERFKKPAKSVIAPATTAPKRTPQNRGTS